MSSYHKSWLQVSTPSISTWLKIIVHLSHLRSNWQLSYVSKTHSSQPVSNTDASVYLYDECKKKWVDSCAVGCFHCCPEGCWMEFRHQLWVLLERVGTGYIWPGKGKTLFLVPQCPLEVTFQRMLFPPWTKRVTLFVLGKFPRKWAITWVGSCPALMEDLTFGKCHSSAILHRSGKIWRGLWARRKVWSF